MKEWLHHPRYVGAPVRQENHLPKVASRSPTLFESVLLIRPGSRAEATQIVDSWNRPVVSEVLWSTSSLSPLERWRAKSGNRWSCACSLHPCKVNKTIRIAASAVMDYLEPIPAY